MQTPKRLDKDPIVEAIFEIRFQSNIKNIKDILPGLLYQDTKDDYPDIEQLPGIIIPAEILQQHPQLDYQPTHYLRGHTFTISLGEKVCNLSCAKPYQGWDKFYNEIKKLLDLLEKTTLINKVERVSIKYLNLLTETHDNPLDDLNMKGNLGSHDLKQHSVEIKTKVINKDIVSLISVNPNVQLRLHNTEIELNGLLLDIDSHHIPKNNEFWTQTEQILENLHTIEKDLFFDILTEQAIKQLAPIF